MHPMLNTAVRAARQAGRIINRASLDLDTLAVARKQRNDFVTEVDRASEEAIIEVLRTAYPNHSILAEESGHDPKGPAGHPREAEHIWIIDPLDGTTNFIHLSAIRSVHRAHAERCGHPGSGIRPVAR